ncbi:MAG: UDP-2,3-diacylglucosamine diphosphatase [Chlorobiales bacterium]|nr:UDP-2,3-diacylglucosamine diphosphatase [Chlorobiales bacterium]
MSKSFFISDIHFGLQADHEENIKVERFRQLSGIISKEGGALYMVGDMLDYWMEFHHVIPKHFSRFFCLLEGLVRQGIDVHYYAGNHDFYLGDYFSSSLGVHTWYGMRESVIGGKKFVIAHGDGLDRSDIGYRFFVKFVRNRFNLSLLSTLQPDLAIAIMRYLSRLGRKHGGSNIHREADFLLQHADTMAGTNDFDYFVCGHSHLRSHKKLSNSHSEYINLGTWIDGEYPYGVFDGRTFSLEQL